MNQEFLRLLEQFNPQFNQPLNKFTTWQIGGPAEVLVIVENSEQLEQILKLALDYEIKYTILGWGSNILISDKGLEGLVIVNKGGRGVEVVSRNSSILSENDDQETTPSKPSVSPPLKEGNLEAADSDQYNIYIQPRHSESGDAQFYSFADLDYEEFPQDSNLPLIEGAGGYPTTKVTFDSSVDLSFAIAWSLKNNLTGLQWFSGIPGTIGGALFNNIHGGTKHFSDNFNSAKLLIPKTALSKWQVENQVQQQIFEELKISGSNYLVKIVGFDFFNFGYDQSLLRQNLGITVLTVSLNLLQGDVQKARYVASEWARRKRIQPRISCGSVFQALPQKIQEKLGYPTPSAGYIIDKVLGLKGKQLGGVKIADNHANFIENTGGGKAEEVLILIKEIIEATQEKTDYKLVPEINFLGFTEEELAGIV